jgi:hypothetical protein
MRASLQTTGDPEIGRKAQKATAQIATILYGKQGIEERKWAPAEAESIRCMRMSVRVFVTCFPAVAHNRLPDVCERVTCRIHLRLCSSLT